MLTSALAAMAAVIAYRGTVDSRGGAAVLAMQADPVQEEATGALGSGDGVPEQGGSTHAINESNKGDNGPESGHFFDLHRPEEGQQQAQAGHQSAMGQQPPENTEVQNDNDEGREGSNHGELLDDKNGPHGLLLGSASPRGRPEVSGFSMAGKDISVHVPPLRPGAQSYVHNEVISPRGATFTRAGAQVDDLYRRFADSGGHSRTMQGNDRRGFQIAKRLGGYHQRGKVSSSTDTENGVFGFRPRFNEHGDFGSQEENQQHKEGYSSSSQQAYNYSTPPSLGVGKNQQHGGCNVSNKSPYNRFGRTENRTAGDGVGFLSPVDFGSYPKPNLVEREYVPAQWPTAYSAHGGLVRSDGRFGLWLGSMDRNPTRLGAMGGPIHQGTGERAHQLQGAYSSLLYAHGPSHLAQGQGGEARNRQHDGDVVLTKNGRNEPKTGTLGPANLFNPKSREHISGSVSLTGNNESNRGRGIPGDEKTSLGLQLRQKRVSQAESSSRTVFDGHFCNLPEQTAPSLRVSGPSTGDSVDGCHGPLLAGGAPLGVSSSHPHRENSSEAGVRAVFGDNLDASLAEPAMVADAPAHEGRRSNDRPAVASSPTSPIRRPSDASLGFRRLDDLRFALRQKGYDEQTISTVLKAWAPATNSNYDGHWKDWSDFARNRGADPGVEQSVLLADWLATIIVGNKKAKEGTVEKAKTVITGFWDVVRDPLTTMNKLQMAAAKANGAKSKGLPSIWNLYYLQDYVHDLPIEELSHRDLTMNAVVKIRGTLGWRTSDIRGLFLDSSFVFANGVDGRPGVWVRAFNLKTGQGRWSGMTFIPRLPSQYKDLCTVRVIEALCVRIRAIDTPHRASCTVLSPSGRGEITDFPIFVYKKGKKRDAPGDGASSATWQYLHQDTLKNYFKEYFMANVAYADKHLSDSFKPHSCRNALASLLHSMSVPAASIAAHMQTTAESLQKTYIRPIVDPSTLPPQCLQLSDSLVIKLIIPFVHYKTSDAQGAGCQCSLLFSKTSIEEQGNGAKG
jgi:hypothetical protein